jgi:hypothetical protein
LRREGYDDCVAVEFQEPYMSVEGGLRLSIETLRAAMPRDRRRAATGTRCTTTEGDLGRGRERARHAM